MRTVRFHVDRQAELQPEKIYMYCPEPGLELTYQDLRQDSIELACKLYDRGCKKGDKVAFMMGNGYQTAKLFIGAMYAGLVAAPLNLQAQPSQLSYVLEHSDSRLVFTTEFQQERLMKALKQVDRKIEVVVIEKDATRIFPKESSHIPQLLD